MSSSLKILVKFPSRGRPEQFLKVLRMMVEMSTIPESIHYLVSIDTDDESMRGGIITRASAICNAITFVYGASKTKIEAINRDMSFTSEWDIVLLASDDMLPQVKGWDEVIRKAFGEETVNEISTSEAWTSLDNNVGNGRLISSSPNLDQALWFFDGHQHRICTLIVMGKKRYEKFGYLYHPSYISLWCDNEWTGVNQPKKFEQILFKHEHPAWGGGVPNDALYVRNEAYFERDRMNFEKRKQLNFPI